MLSLKHWKIYYAKYYFPFIKYRNIFSVAFKTTQLASSSKLSLTVKANPFHIRVFAIKIRGCDALKYYL